MRYGKTVIWFNQWFSTIHFVIKALKYQRKDIMILASSRNKEHVYLTEADEVIYEPESGHGYAEFAIDVCKKYGVDIFFVKREMLTLSMYKPEFDRLGVQMVCDKFSSLNIFDNKDITYRLIRDTTDKINIPTYGVVKTAEELQNELHKFFNSGKKLAVIKNISDEGADSVRMVSANGIASNTFVKGAPNLTISEQDAVLSYLKSKRKPMMVMEYLKGPEVSVDCYISAKGDIAIPRFKMGKRVEEVRYHKEIMEQALAIGHMFKLEFPYNVQFRWLGDKPYLLEVNPRISGGIQFAIACGFNIPMYVVKDILYENYTLPELKEGDCYRFTQIETPVMLKENKEDL